MVIDDANDILMFSWKIGVHKKSGQFPVFDSNFNGSSHNVTNDAEVIPLEEKEWGEAF